MVNQLNATIISIADTLLHPL